MRKTTRLLLLVLIATPAGVAAQDLESPEAAARAMSDRMKEADWEGMAALMHPAALETFRAMVEPILSHPAGGQLRDALFGAPDSTGVSGLSDAQLFGRFIGAVLSQDPAMRDAVRNAEVDVIGHIMEGDTAHVVARSRLQFEGVPMSQMEVSSFVRHDGRWLGLLTGEFSGMAAAFGRMLEVVPVPGDPGDPWD
ncbi:MAG TPA: hypothetical protein VMM12_13695 [Longimicrobiales bacterium]|nr:hypothetical protein [Longimicrobiales bacterium]